jgi:type II secretory pathway pseudopilin PulG
MIYTTTKQRGFTLVETLFYLGGLVLLLSIISLTLIYTYDWHRSTTIGSKAEIVGITLVDRIVRDIRGAESVNDESVLLTNNGTLSITSASTTNIIKRFYISNDRLTYLKDSEQAIYLSPSGLTVSRFYITELTSPKSSAVKFDIDISYLTKTGTTTKTYSGFGILRQSYE